MKNKHILEFAKIISGIFSNKKQALENPKKFAHIQIHIRPLFFETFKCYAFYSEQRYQYDIWNPYRQSINKLFQEKDFFIISNHKLENKERFTGGALDIALLNDIENSISYQKEGCSMFFKEENPGTFFGNIEPGEKCYIEKGSEKIFVQSEVILNKNTLISEDSGHKKETGEKIWGSNFGALVFKKIDNFDTFIDKNWK